jgi:transcriptional regulator with XRE-family HTH domain
MAEVERLFAEFVEAHLGGRDPDPSEYIGHLGEGDRQELEELIDAYYVDAPPRPWDAEAFRGSDAERLVDAIDRSFRGRAGLWPAVLPRLRDRARLKRSDLVAKLAKTLGVSDREQKVASYYHEMEQGLLASAGVSSRVLDGLAEILGVTADSLRETGRALRTDVGEADDAVFARTARPSPAWQLEHAEAAPPPGAASAEREAEWDEVDKLFRGGDRE